MQEFEHSLHVPLDDPPQPMLYEPLEQREEHWRQVPLEDPPHPLANWPEEHWPEHNAQLADEKLDANVPLGHGVQEEAEN